MPAKLKLTYKLVDQIVELKRDGLCDADIIAAIGVNQSTFYRWLKDGENAELGDTVAVIDTSRDPEWRLTARIVKRVRTFGETVTCRMTVGTVQKADYEQVSALVADVATLQNDVVGIDGNLTSAASTEKVTEIVTEAIDDLDELGELDF